MFLTFFHWFNCHLYIGFSFKPFSPLSQPLFSIFISLVSHSLLGQTYILNPFSLFPFHYSIQFGVLCPPLGVHVSASRLCIFHLCLCAVFTQAQKKLVISFFAKISICIISEMCFFIQHFQTDEFGNPQLLYYPV